MNVIRILIILSLTLLVWCGTERALADEQTQKQPLTNLQLQSPAEDELQTEPYAYWREWFRAHEGDADLSPLSQWTPPTIETLGESNVIMRDPLTGETRQGTLRELFPHAFNERGEFVPFNEGRGDDRDPLDEFTVGEIIENPSVSPWKVNCKLYISANGGTGQGSGILIDAKHVLTAGHCVYNIDIDEWVDMIEVIPAFDEWGRPYGTAFSSNLFTWTGWTVNHDWNWDLAVVELDRPVGAITGWLDYYYNNDNNWFFTNTFHSLGYPGGPPFDGIRLNHRTGPFDSANVNILYEHDTTSYGGMSGGGVYYRDFSNNTRTVYAVASHGWNGYGGFNRITSTKRSGIYSYIHGNHPYNNDLVALDCNVWPSVIEAGSEPDSVSFLIYNDASSSAYSGNVTVSLHLSTNEVISSSDYLLDTETFTVNLDSGESVRLEWNSLPEFSCFFLPGDRWVGVILDVADENSGNNSSSYDDAAPIEIVRVPPGNPTSPSPSNNTTNVLRTASLSWSAGHCASSHDVYFGTTNPPPFVVNQSGMTYDPPGAMVYATRYYWRIDEVNSAGTTTGSTWTFVTEYPALPGQAGDPVPANNSPAIPVTTTIAWSAGLGYTESFDVYFGTVNPPPFVTNMFLQEYDPPGNLVFDDDYYWRIDSRNVTGVTTGNVWVFHTQMEPPLAATYLAPLNGATNIPVSGAMTWTQGARTQFDRIFFGTTNPPPQVAQSNFHGTYDPTGNMLFNQTYFWRVDEVNNGGVTPGETWSFTTAIFVPMPGMPSNPNPADGAVNVPTRYTFSFSPGANAVTHEMWIDDPEWMPFLVWSGTDTIVPESVMGAMDSFRSYLWRIHEVNSMGTTVGPFWSFTTGEAIPTGPPTELTIQIVPTGAELRWNTAVHGYYYYVFRSINPDFVPSNFVGMVWDTTLVDTTIFTSPDEIRYYRVIAGP